MRRNAGNGADALKLIDAELSGSLLRLRRLAGDGGRTARPEKRRSLLDVVVLTGFVWSDFTNDDVNVIVCVVVVAIAERIVVVVAAAVVAIAVSPFATMLRRFFSVIVSVATSVSYR